MDECKPLGTGSRGAGSDDLTIIEFAKDNNSWICSNDQFRAGAYTRPHLCST